jgi:hypothetical protein
VIVSDIHPLWVVRGAAAVFLRRGFGCIRINPPTVSIRAHRHHAGLLIREAQAGRKHHH